MSALARTAHVHAAAASEPKPPQRGTLSPLSPGAQVEDGWETPLPSAGSSPAPLKCHELPDYEPQQRNHQRSKDSQWNQASYPAQAPPLASAQHEATQRPRPIRLCTPSSGYPFPWVLSRQNTRDGSTTADTKDDTPAKDDSGSTSSSSPPSDADSTPSDRRPPSSSFSLSPSSSDSECSTPRDGSPPESPFKEPASRSQTPFEISHARTKNASNTPGAPPPLSFAGDGHAQSFVDYRDVKDQTDDQDGSAPSKPVNPLVAGLRGLSVQQQQGGKVD
ncbi:hypothetical protein JCM10212_000815 [Sporobolomyces blumeae]